ncbi:MAG: MATE family efflux transporter, partial [Bacteroidota bacterium]
MKDLTTGKESKVILFFALPMLIGNVFQQSYNIIDSIIVGNYLGKEAVAAIGAAFPIIFFLISMVIGITSGGTIIVAQFFGAKDYGSVKKTIDTLLIFLFFASLIVTGIGLLIAPHVFYWMNLEQSSIPDAINYIMIYFSGMIFFFGFNGVSAILRGLGDSKTPLYFLVIATVINIGLDFLFILGMNMGVSGAAFATLVSQGLAFAAAVIYLNKKHEYINFSFRYITFDKEIFRKAIRIGLPSGIQQSLVAIGAFVMFWIVNDFGTNATAAYSIASRIDSFALIPAMNFAMALTTFVGQNVGAGLEVRAIKGLKTTMVMSGIISVS